MGDDTGNTWKLQDAKARFSEVVRRARAGEPQQVTVHGQQAVVVFDPQRFELRAKPDKPRTMADFIEATKKYRGAGEGVAFEHYTPMHIGPKPFRFDEDE
jgi:prevent-host-death family protein